MRHVRPCPGGIQASTHEPASFLLAAQTREAARSLTTALRNRRRCGKQDPTARSILKQVSSLSLGPLFVSLSHTLPPCRSSTTTSIYSLSLSQSTLGGGQRRLLPVDGGMAGDSWARYGLCAGNGLTNRLENGLTCGLEDFICFLCRLTKTSVLEPVSVE